MTTNNDELDLLSIDIGINTFHILEHIEIKPRVIVTEYNAKLRDKIECAIITKMRMGWR